jgi:hypothetical protein
MALHYAPAPARASLPLTDMDRIEALRAVIARLYVQALIERANDPNDGFAAMVVNVSTEALHADNRAAQTQDEQQNVIREEPGTPAMLAAEADWLAEHPEALP